MSVRVRSPLALLFSLTALSAVAPVHADDGAPVGADARDQQIWERFVKSEQKAGAADRGLSAPSGAAVTGDYSGNYYGQAGGQSGTIVVPQTFMPPVYQRPLELYSNPQPGDFSFNPRQAGAWYGGSGQQMPGLGQPGWSLGALGGGMPSLGLSSLLRGFTGGSPLGGFGGIPSVPGVSSMGGYGGWSPFPGGGGASFGNAWRPANNMYDMGNMGRPAVYQLQPSKPSGNYYAPSTVDSTASGSYYAQTSPSTLPVTVPQSEPGPRDYWGPQGNPFGNAFNTQPPH